MINIIKLFLFCVSNIGTWELIRRNSKISVYFLPGLTIAIQTVVLFVGGLLNLLPEFMWILYIVGFAGFAYGIYKDKGISFLKNYMNIGFLFMAVSMGIMLIYLRGKLFMHYDNFSHWAMVVKRMIAVDRYPNFTDTIIKFQEYPLGSSTYIYYFSKLISTSESIQMLAQVYMMLSSILPVFVFIKKNKIAALAVVFSAVNFILVYNIEVTDLLVDTLLPLVAMSGLVFAYRYCKRSCRIRNLIFASFYMVQIVQIKNSGMFFVALICILILSNIRKDKSILARIGSVMMPFISFFMWQRHCKYVFADAEVSKHAMSVENYSSVFEEKTAEDINLIFNKVIDFAAGWTDVWLTFAIILIIGILIFIFAKRELKNYRNVLIASLVVYVVYQAGILAMYLFSMPMAEARSLAGMSRYTKTILIAILYIALIMSVKLISCLDKSKIAAMSSAVILGALYFLYMQISFGNIKTPMNYTDDTDERMWLETARIDYGVQNQKSYAILIPEDDSGYFYYLGEYTFQTDNVDSFVVDSREDMENISSEYIFVNDYSNQIINDWIKENYPEQYGNAVIKREIDN